MITIIDKNTGVVKYVAQDKPTPKIEADELIIDLVCELDFNAETQSQFWDFDKKEFIIKDN